MAFADLTAQLQLNISSFSSSLSRAARQMNSFANNMYSSYGLAAKELNKHNLGLKDTVRIVHGIVIAQTFYTAARAIGNATSALWDFNVALDYMHVTYSALFGDTKVASDFMSVLQEHSIETIFDYQNLADASKKLLAYGIEYKNLMFIMEGLTNLGAMSGDSAALDRISLALGQIYTKGKLSAEEMRQLANAYIPITDILKDKFGLTGDDLKRVGDLNLPAADVINAIVDYANENFGSVGDAAMYTITGLQNRIVDTLKVVGSSMLTPITTAYKSFLAYISEGLEALRAEYSTGGLGGVFEFLVPDEGTQRTIRQFIANVGNLLMSLASVGTVVGKVFGSFAQVVATAFNILSPIVIGFINTLAAVINAFLSTERGATLLRVALVAAAGAFVILKVNAIAALVITAVTKAVIGLSKALVLLASLVTKHPILALLAGLAIALVGVSTASSGANEGISKLFNTLSGAGGGLSQEDVLQKVEQKLTDSADAANQFNNRLEDGAETAEELEDAINGAGKAAKKTGGLLSFDEVFKLPEPSNSSGSGSGAGTGVADDVTDLIAGLGTLGDALIPDIPDFSEYVNGFTDGLFGGLSDSISSKLKSAGIGALIGGGIGAIIGGILGGPAGAALGAKIGMFAGGLVGLIADELDGAMSNAGVGLFAGLSAALAKAFSSAFGTPLITSLAGALKGGGIGAMFKVLGSSIKTTGLKSLLKGGIIGAAIGLVVDGIAHLLWNTLAEEFDGANVETAKVGQTIGSVIGAVIGGIIGGPGGAIIGSAIGTFVTGLVGLFWEPITEYFDPATNPLTAFFVDTAEQVLEWGSSTLESLSTWWSDTTTGFSDWWDDTFKGFSDWWDDTFGGLSTWFNDTVAIFSDWDSINGETLSTWITNTVESFTGWWTDTTTGFETWKTDTIEKFSTWAQETFSGLIAWYNDTSEMYNDWKADINEILFSWAKDALKAVVDWIADTYQGISDWVSDVYQAYLDFKEDVLKVLVGFAIAAKEAIEDGITDMRKSITDGLTNIGTKWSEKWASIRTALSEWWSDMGPDMEKWLDKYIWTPIGKFFGIDNFWEKIKGLLNAIKKKFTSWWEGITDIFSGNVDVSPTVTGTSTSRSKSGVSFAGHATGGVFNREHLARFAEGNKAEAVIPLENRTAMQPFVDAVSGGIVSSLAPIVAQINTSNSNNLPPMYVGTLIADDRGLRQLYKKFEVIQIQESARRGAPQGGF